MDPRIIKLSRNIVSNCVKVKKGEHVLIDCKGYSGLPLVRMLVKETYKAGGLPFVNMTDTSITREILLNGSEKLLKKMADFDLYIMKEIDCFIGINASDNQNELHDVPSTVMSNYMKHYAAPVHLEERVKNTKWTVLCYPNNSSAQQAELSLEGFEEFYFKVCNLDYQKMSKAMDPLVTLMNKTDKVRINGKGTDLNFSIKDIPSIKCDGTINLPDGEVFTAPVKHSVNGTISYNCPAVYQGYTYENIVLKFSKGKIVEAIANNTEKINSVFDTDESSRYIGEFAIGVNPYIIKPVKNSLFDEKIMGSFHLTPGKCYEEAPNGNGDAGIHWDLVCIQTPEYGGGEIYFDDLLIRKDGVFILQELEGLNPENLK